MKKFLLPVLALMSLNSFAGNEKGNGGGMHYCPAKANQEVYDVYEGKKRYQLEIIDTANTVSEKKVLSNAIKKLANKNQRFAEAVKDQIEFMSDERNFRLDPDIQLTPVPDANILMVDRGCGYEQLANWDDVSNSVFVRADLFEKMTSFNKAALKLHEAVYKASRIRVDVKNSDKVRRFVAELLSTSDTLTDEKDFNITTDVLSSNGPEGFSYVSDSVGTINLGKVSIAEVETLGTIKVTALDFVELAERRADLEMRIANLRRTGTRREVRRLEEELRNLTTFGDFSFTSIRDGESMAAVGSNRLHTLKADIKTGSIGVIVSLSSYKRKKVTLEIEFTDFTGKTIKSLLPVNLSELNFGKNRGELHLTYNLVVSPK